MQTPGIRWVGALCSHLGLLLAGCISAPSHEADNLVTPPAHMETASRVPDHTPASAVHPTETPESPPSMGTLIFSLAEPDIVTALPRPQRLNDIWTLEDGSKALRRWIDDGLAKMQPMVSPDGTQVAYVATRIHKNGLESSVWIAGRDGAAPRQIRVTILSSSKMSLVSVVSMWLPPRSLN